MAHKAWVVIGLRQTDARTSSAIRGQKNPRCNLIKKMSAMNPLASQDLSESNQIPQPAVVVDEGSCINCPLVEDAAMFVVSADRSPLPNLSKREACFEHTSNITRVRTNLSATKPGL